jgi:hypothetical protein
MYPNYRHTTQNLCTLTRTATLQDTFALPHREFAEDGIAECRWMRLIRCIIITIHSPENDTSAPNPTRKSNDLTRTTPDPLLSHPSVDVSPQPPAAPLPALHAVADVQRVSKSDRSDAGNVVGLVGSR